MQTMQKFYKEIAQGASDDPQIRGVVALTKMSLDRLRTVKGPTRSWHIAHQKRALFRDGLVRWRVDRERYS